MIVSTHDLNLAAALCERIVLLKQGRVLAQGPTEETLTAENIRSLYDVDADVQFHPAGRSPDGGAHCPNAADAIAGFRPRTPVRRRLMWTLAGFGTLAARRLPARAARRQHADPACAAVFDRSIPYADNIDAQIFFVARLPRVLAAALVGSALALAGVVFQALLRNPLASPDTLGVSAGASLGAMMAITFDARLLAARRLGRAAGELRRIARRARRSSTACRRPDAAARPPIVLLLGGRDADGAALGGHRASCSTWPTSPRRSATCAG